MKRIFAAALILAVLSLVTAFAFAEGEAMPEITIVPQEWNSPAAQQGRVETFEYTTGTDTKTAYVYLPYGYDESLDTRYNILYFMWDYDVYSEIGNYNNPVLLMHGDADYIVPISYAERAAEVYPDVEYHVMPGAGHGFHGQAFEDSMELSFAYLQRVGVLGASAQPQAENETAVCMTFGDGTVAMMTDIRNNATARAFLDMLPMTVTMQDWDGREYWYSDNLPYDEDSVQHTYAIGEFTYWCGGWVTAYYSTNEDTVIEAGSVVIGMMDDAAVQQFAQADGATQTITFEIIEE